MNDLPNTAQALIRNSALLEGRVALIGPAMPQLVSALALPQPPLVLCEHAGLVEQLTARGDCEVVFGYPDGPVPAWNTVVVFMPKARSALAMQLACATSLLVEGGRLLLVGEKKEGIAGGVKALQLVAPDAAKKDSARHCQVWLGFPPVTGAGFDPLGWLSWHSAEAAGVAVDVAGMPGVFSDGRLDAGTELLLSTFTDSPRGPVLDFACGAGVIGAWLQRRFPDIGPVDGIDVQAQACICARETYRRNGVDGRILASDGLPPALGRYTTLVTNPPFHTGVRTDTTMTERFLASARQHLLPGGEMRLVANRFLPYRDWLHRGVGPTEVLAENSRFVVYQSTRS